MVEQHTNVWDFFLFQLLIHHKIECVLVFMLTKIMMEISIFPSFAQRQEPARKFFHDCGGKTKSFPL